MKPARTRAIYAGSFDPITLGHLDIIQKALLTFDVVHVAVGVGHGLVGVRMLVALGQVQPYPGGHQRRCQPE